MPLVIQQRHIASHAFDKRAFESVVEGLPQHHVWRQRLQDAIAESLPSSAVHLAVFVEPYLEYLLDGRKTIESRFSAIRCAPFGRVAADDLVLVKVSGGPIVGIAEVGDTWFYRLDKTSWKTIRRDFAVALCAQDPGFWSTRQHAAFATLIKVRKIERVPPVAWKKKDRRGWVVLTQRDPGLWDHAQ